MSRRQSPSRNGSHLRFEPRLGKSPEKRATRNSRVGLSRARRAQGGSPVPRQGLRARDAGRRFLRAGSLAEPEGPDPERPVCESPVRFLALRSFAAPTRCRVELIETCRQIGLLEPDLSHSLEMLQGLNLLFDLSHHALDPTPTALEGTPLRCRSRRSPPLRAGA